MNMRVLWGAVLLASLSGCSWVKLVPGADRVDVLAASEVAQCERLGAATAKSMNKFAFVERDREKLAGELVTLARNEAEAMGGNAVVAESEITEGRQRFGVYKCH